MQISRRNALSALIGAGVAAQCLPAQASGSSTFSYYIDSVLGNDTNDGRTPSAPKKSLAALSTLRLQPGQSVGLKRGCTWREVLRWSQSGVAGQPITFGAYGDGSAPLISASGLRQWSPQSVVTADRQNILFYSDVEVASLADFTSVAQYGRALARRSQSQAFSGSGSLEIIGDGTDNRAWATCGFAPVQIGDTYFFRFSMKTLNGTLKANSELRSLRVTSPANRCFYLSFNTDNKGLISSLTFNGDGPGCGNLVGQKVSVAGIYQMDAWNNIDLSWKVHGTAGGGEVFINQKYVCRSFILNTLGSAGANAAFIGNEAYAGAITSGKSVFYDSVTIATAATATTSNTGIWSTPQITLPSHVVFGDSLGTRVTSSGELNLVGKWFWDPVARVVMVMAAGDPASTVEIPERQNAIVMDGASFVTLSGIRWRGASAEGVLIRGVSNGTTLDNCVGELCYAEGAFIDAYLSVSAGGRISNSEFRQNGASGLRVNGNFTNWLIRDSSFHHNGQVLSNATPSHNWTAGLKLWGDSRYGQGTVVDSCSVYSNGCQVDDQAKGLGLWVDQAVGITVCRNLIYDNDAWGLYLEKTDSCVAYCNTIYSCAKVASWCAGLGIKASESFNSTRNGVFHNVVYDSGFWGLYCGAYQGVGACRFDSNTIQNNIVCVSRRELFYTETGGSNNGTGGSGNAYTNNCFGPERQGLAVWDGRTLNTYADWQSAYGSQMANVTTDPRFIDPSARNFGLQLLSPCRLAGITVAALKYQSALQPDLGPILLLP